MYDQVSSMCDEPVAAVPRQDCDKYTVRSLVSDIIVPRTAGKGMGYALLMNRLRPLRAEIMVCRQVGLQMMPGIQVSHAWDESASGLESAILKFLADYIKVVLVMLCPSLLTYARRNWRHKAWMAARIGLSVNTSITFQCGSALLPTSKTMMVVGQALQTS